MSNGNLYPLGTKRWLFVTSDAAATVFASGYFNDLAGVLEVYDILEIQCVLNGQTVFYSTSVDADTNTSCSVRLPAQLATTESSLAASLAALESRVATLEANTGSGTIQYPGIISFQSTTRAANEQSVVYITITRTSGSDGVVTADLAYTGTLTKDTHFTTDLEPGVAAVSFADGELSKTIALTIGDIAADGTIILTMSNVSPAASAGQVLQCTVNVTAAVSTSPGTIRFSAASYSITEPTTGTTTVTLTAIRENGAVGAVSCTATLGGGTAQAGTDYTAATPLFSWADGEAGPKTQTVTILANTTGYVNTNFSASLNTPLGGASLAAPVSATINIINVHTDPGTTVGDFYVSASATGGGSGALNDPWTVAEYRANAAAGNLIIFLPGTYNLSTAINDNDERWTSPMCPDASGTEGNPIVVRAQYDAALLADDSSLRSIINITGSYLTGALAVGSRTDIVFRGFSVDERNFTAPQVNDGLVAGAWNSSRIKFQYNRIITDTALGGGINHAAIRFETTTACEASDNKVTSPGVYSEECGILLYGSTQTRLYNNEVIGGRYGIRIKGDTIDQQLYNPLYIYNNYIHDSTFACLSLGGPSPATGTETCDVHGNLILHTGSGPALFWQSFDVDSPAYFRFVNNTVVSTAGFSAMLMWNGAGADGTIATGSFMRNNIFYANHAADVRYIYSDTGAINDTILARIDSDYNLFDGQQTDNRFISNANGDRTLAVWQAGGQDTNSVISTPGFVGGGDYKLAGGSSGIDAGIDILDLRGGGTGGAVNIGCYALADQSDEIGVRAA